MFGYSRPLSTLSARSDPLKWAGGAASRGVLIWVPFGEQVQGNTPYYITGNAGDTGAELTAKMAMLKAQGWGHIRIGIDVGPLIGDSGNIAVHLNTLGIGISLILAQGLKVVVNLTPALSWSGQSAAIALDNGAGQAAYKAMVGQVAGYLHSNIQSFVIIC